MNSLTKRKITAVAVSLMLVAVIVTTGLLCAPNLNKSNTGDVPIENMAAYNAYDNYGMTKLTPSDFNSSNTDVIYFGNNISGRSADMRIMFPTEIYMDKAENLADAGYYFFGDYYDSKATAVTSYWWTYASLFGYYRDGITGAGYLTTDNENTMNNVFSGSTGYSITQSASSGASSISTGYDGPNILNTSTQYKNDYWNVKINGNTNALVKYTMNGSVNQNIENKTYTFTSPNKVGIAYQRATWIGGSDAKDLYEPSVYTEGSGVNHKLSSGEGIELSAGYEYKSGITIQITIYDKSKLYEAVQTLTTNRNELSGYVDSSVITAADNLIKEANDILKERKTNQTTINSKLEEIEAFKFPIARPGTTNLGWTFGDADHADGSNTYLNALWTKYDRNIAKYFDVEIDNNIYGQWDANKTTPISTQNRKVNDASSYDSQGYVRDAGDYTITFTPKDLLCGIEWTTNATDTTHTMTMTINRASMQSVTPVGVADRQYTGSAQTYTMSTDGSVVQLKGNMVAANANLVVKLLKDDPGADNHEKWDAANCVNSISFTEVGTHTVYYRIQADNHNAWRGSYTVKITPATVNVVFGVGLINQNDDGSVLTYGDGVLSSEQIITQGVTNVTFNGGSSTIVNKSTLNNILTFGLLKDASGSEFVTNNLTNAGEHSVGVSGYKTITNRTQDEIKENPSIVTWDQRITVTLSGEDRAYSIAKKEIEMEWGSLGDQIYDGLGNHRPDVNVKAGEEVSGGEVFKYTTYVLTGAEAGRSEGMAGVIDVGGITYEVPLTDGGNAIWAGSYIVGVQYDENSNYRVSDDTRTTPFEIKQRKLVVNVLDRTSDYAQAMSDMRDVNAQTILDTYQGAMFEDNTGNNKVYEFADGTSLAIAGSASRVFELDIVNVPTTNPNLGSSDAFYCAGVHTGALVARLRTANEVDSRGDAVDMNRIRSYDFSFTAGTFTVNEAEIRSTRQYMRKTFNGEEQEFALKLEPIVLSGYESIHRAEAGVVTIKYSTSFNGPFTTDPIKLRDYDNGEGVLIYYQIEAANHKTTEILNFTANMDRLFLDVTIGNIKNVGNAVYYGDEIPNSDQLQSLLDISYETRKSDAATDDDEGESSFVLEDNLQFYIANGGQKVTDNKIGAGLYTLNLEPLDASVNSLNNYNITFLGNGGNNANENAFEISQRPLVIDWRQTSSSNWIDNGMNFVYNATIPRVQPIVRPYRYADLSLYGETSIGDKTFDDDTNDYVRNFIEGDVIELSDQYLAGATYTEQGYLTNRTTLSKQENIKNYVLVNPTATFYIVKRTVEINVFDKTAQYGSAKTVTLGNLADAGASGANWEYHDGNTYQFIRDHYMNWMLSSFAIEGGANVYQNVGSYNIVLEEDPGNDGNVANNYEIIVYRKQSDGTITPATHANAAIFEITEADFSLARREFNFDASPRNPDATTSSPVEDCVVSVADIKDIIRLVGGTSKDDLTVSMSAPISYSTGNPGATLPTDIEMLENRVVELTTDEIGKWYVWISIRNSNYNPIDVTIDINYLTNWISIRLGDKIQANYGDKVMESDELFEELNILSIQGVMNDEGTAQLELKEALEAIKERGYFTFFVGRGDKSPLEKNESVGFYSVYMNVSTDKEIIGEGENELHFRFLGAEVGKGVTSNVDVYQVIPRPIYIAWNTSISEIYGDHSNTSASHTGYTVMNAIDDDVVGVVIKYAPNDAYGDPGEMYGNHVHYVGDYIATLDGVSHQNYRKAEIGDRIQLEDGSTLPITSAHLQKEFRINEREITVTIKDQTLVYGSLNARENADSTSNNNIYNFVNASSAYYVSDGSIYDEDIPSEIFDLRVRYTLAAGCNYLDVNTYSIYGSRLDNKTARNYNVRFVREGAPLDREAELEITNANFTIDSMQFNTIFFDGKEHSPLNYNNGDALSYTFAGDADVVFAGRTVYFNANVNATASDSGWVLATSERLTFRNAGTHQFAVMVEAPNHNARIRNDITFTILAVNVNIDMTKQATKIYGDVIGDGTEKAISDFIKANTGITYEVTTSKDPWHIDNVADAFIFYVVVGGEQGADGGEGIEVGNFANGVGEYRVYHKFADGERGNYNVSYTQNGNVGCNAKAFKILPKEVEVVWYIGDVDNQDIASEYTYTGKPIGLQAAFEAIRYNEDTKQLERYYEQLVVFGGAELDARQTPYTASADFGWMRNVSDNYTLKGVTTSFQYKINPRDIVVVLKNQGTTYGVENYNFDSTESAWAVGDDDIDEWPSIPNANMVLELKLPQTSGYVSSGMYDIQAVCGNTNFAVTFTDEEGKIGWGKYVIAKATIENVPTHMDDLVYNGADQNVDIFKHISEHIDTAVVLKGDMKWAQATVTYMNASGNYVATMPTVKNAGTHTVDFKITLANHEDYTGTMNVNVAKATILFTADVYEIQYGDKALTSDEIYEKLNIRVSDKSQSELAVDLKELVSFSVSGDAVNVGEYRIFTTLLDSNDAANIEVHNDQDTPEKDAVPYHVVPRVITVNWGNTSWVYNANWQYFIAESFNNVMSNDTISAPTYSILVNDIEETARGIDVGKYTVKIFVNGNNRNYVVDEDSRYQTFYIVPKEVDIEWNVKDFVYDGNGHMLTATIVGGVYSGDDCSIITYSPEVVSAGIHTARVVELSNENYTVSDSATQEFEIEQKEVIIVWEIESFIYNGSEQCIKAHVSESSLIGNDTCEVVVSGNGKDAGIHRAIVTKLSNANYKLPAGGAGQEYAIAPRTIKSISWSNTSLTYAEVNGVAQAQVPTAAVLDGMVPGDTVEFDIIIAEGEAINVGTYRATVVGVKGGNYVLDASVSNTSTSFEIKKAENALDNNLTLPVKDGGLPALADFESVSSRYGSAIVKYFRDVDLTDEYTGSLSDAPKGTYYVVVMVEGTQNYDTVSRTFTVDVEGSSNAGLIAGIVIPIVVLVIAATIVAIVVVKKKKGKKDDVAQA